MNKTPTIQICCWSCKSHCKGNAENGFRPYCRKTGKGRDVNSYCDKWQPRKIHVNLEIGSFEKNKAEARDEKV